VCGKGQKLLILGQNGLEGGEQGGLLLVLWRAVRRLEDDLEGQQVQFRRRGQDALVASRNDPVLRRKTINDLAQVARKNFFSRAERRLQQTFGEDRPSNESVQAVARIVGVKRDQSVKVSRADFLLEKVDLRLF